MRRLWGIFSLLLILVIFGCKPSSEPSKIKKIINGAGGSFPYILYANWASEYYKLTGIKINYQSIGSGGGIRQIIERTVDFGASDLPLSAEEVEKNKLLQFPTVIGAVVPVVNIPEIKNEKLILDGETLCRIYLGKIKKWDEPSIKVLNSNLNLPDKSITPIYRSDASGTTAIFTHYLSEICKDWKIQVGFGTAVNWKAGIGAKGNEGVANYIKRTPYTIGYVELTYAIQNKLSYVKLKNISGNIVEPDEEAVKAALLKADFDPSKHFYIWLTNVSENKAWPIVGATYILLARDKKEINKEIVKFFDWAFRNGDDLAKKLTYIPLSEEIKEKIRDYWKNFGIF